MLGMLILHETMGINKLVGCGAIVLSVILVVLGEQRALKNTATA
jgi:drug/metabolite transporter (DMT)-like permease